MYTTIDVSFCTPLPVAYIPCESAPVTTHICQYCGLNTAPLAYHEGADDCQKAMRIFVSKIRKMLNKDFQSFDCIAHEYWHDFDKLYSLLKDSCGFSYDHNS